MTKGHSHPQLCYTPFQDTTEALVRLLPFLSPETFLLAPTTLPLQAHPVPGFRDVAPFAVKSPQEEKASC